LASAGVEAPLLATNAACRVSEPWQPVSGYGFPLYPIGRGWTGRIRLVPYVLHLGVDRSRGSRREILRNLLWYRRFLRLARPNVIHVQHPLERCQYVRGVQRIEGWRVPLVVTAHSLFGEHAEETIYTFMAPNLRAADLVIAVSEHIADQAIELGVHSSKVRVIRSGVDVDQFQPRGKPAARARLGLPPDAHVVLFVGNLEPRKQVDVLLRAMACLPSVLANQTWLTIVGSGESAGVLDQTPHLVRLADELELKDRVRFTGRVDDQQLLAYYSAADVFVLPSSSEAQGIAALEAMAAGLPVVAAGVGGLLGTVRDGETGFLVPPGDVVALSQRLAIVLQEPVRRHAMGVAAREVVEASFAWPRAVEATVDAYREVLACR
jgi:glycosyltransferase involved in cell wall biosynthesis